MWDHIPEDIRRVFEYIEREIPLRTLPADVKFLRETRAIHFAPFKRRYFKKES